VDEVDLFTGFEVSVDDFYVGENSFVGVEDRVEDEGSGYGIHNIVRIKLAVRA
jgi:hypothetical protein